MPISVKLIEKLIDHQGQHQCAVQDGEPKNDTYLKMIKEHQHVGGGEKEQESV